MADALNENDISHVVKADKAHVWHHLIQHKAFETNGSTDHPQGQGHAGLGPVGPRIA